MHFCGAAGQVTRARLSAGSHYLKGSPCASIGRGGRCPVAAQRSSLKQQQRHRLQTAWQDHSQLIGTEASLSAEPSPQPRPLVILPGFGNCTEDYIAPYGDADAGMLALLQARGYDVTVVQLERSEWLNVARNIFTLKFWTSELTTHPGYTWYLEKVHQAVQEAREASGCDQVDLIGHSAGGWLGRAYLADPEYSGHEAAANEEPNPAVASLITLGSPHQPPPPDKARDMTGGALTWLHKTYPGAYFRDHGVKYVCVAGRAVRGRKTAKRSSILRYAHDAYCQVVGEGHGVEGDAVVPCEAAVLPGATNIILDGVFHSMGNFKRMSQKQQQPQQQEGKATDTEAPLVKKKQRVWYGSDAVLDSWLCTLSDDEAMNSRSSSSVSSGEDVASPLSSLDDMAWRQGVILPNRGSSISSTRVVTAAAPAPAAQVLAPAQTATSAPRVFRMR